MIFHNSQKQNRKVSKFTESFPLNVERLYAEYHQPPTSAPVSTNFSNKPEIYLWLGKINEKNFKSIFSNRSGSCFKELGINTMSAADLKDIMDGRMVSKQAPTLFAFWMNQRFHIAGSQAMFHRCGQGTPSKEIGRYLKLSVSCHSHHFSWDMGDTGQSQDRR